MQCTKLTLLTLVSTLTAAFNITTLRTSTPLHPASDPSCNITIIFTVNDVDTYNASVTPARTAQTSCTASWRAVNGTPPVGWQGCVDPDFGWRLGDDEGNIEGFENVGDFGLEITHGWEEPG